MTLLEARFQKSRKSRAKAAFWHLDVVFLRQSALAGLRHVNLEAQISWQAQHFVKLEVQISWQAQHFVNLKVQSSCQAQHFVNIHAQIS